MQSLIQLPKTADIIIGMCHITIRNHKVTGDFGLFSDIMNIIVDPDSREYILVEFEKHGISFEAAIECCALRVGT